MNKVINYLKVYILYFIILICYILIISLINYFELFSYSTINIIDYVCNMIMFFILGFKISHIERKKGYLNGFLISVILILLFVIISLIIDKITFASIVYYLSLILVSITGGIIGVTK